MMQEAPKTKNPLGKAKAGHEGTLTLAAFLERPQAENKSALIEFCVILWPLVNHSARSRPTIRGMSFLLTLLPPHLSRKRHCPPVLAHGSQRYLVQ